MNSVCVISGTALAERSQDPTYFHIYYNHRGANQGRERKEEKQKTNKKETSEFIELYTSTDEIHCLCIICLRSKVSFKKEQKPEFRWYSGLRICCCHCCGAGVIPGPGTFTSRGTETKWNSKKHNSFSHDKEITKNRNNVFKWWKTVNSISAYITYTLIYTHISKEISCNRDLVLYRVFGLVVNLVRLFRKTIQLDLRFKQFKLTGFSR